ncbi:very short patch repair endonuclease [Paraburkholderia fungorum]|uniref:very short patch repair endonuclease n=1 Tax=Paraburkholderia fungorum TaxID=134537 RepID=UPI0038B8D1DF
MTDILTPDERSVRMSRVRQAGTDVELRLRKALWNAGFRYHLRTANKLPGRPDIVFVNRKVAIFVDGCFWHGCPIHGTKPKTNAQFWDEKIKRNRERDQEVDGKLVEAGWRVIRLWEHEVRKELPACVRRIACVLQVTPR